MNIVISLQIEDVDEEHVDYNLVSVNSCDTITWGKTDEEYPSDHNYGLKIITNNNMNEIIDMRKGEKILSSRQDIKELFLDALLAANIEQQTDEADGFEHTHDNKNQTGSKENNPYDPKLIRVDTKPFSVEHVCKLIKRKELDISPDFQRGFVWTEITRKSRLIESIMLRIPIPVFYLSQDEDGKYQVVDGIQRLTVINDFINNKFKLKNLEYLSNLDGKWFRKEDKPTDDSIPSMYAGRIEDTQLYCNIIDPSTPERVKYDIFRRINTGGKTLNAQEIRNCLSNEKTRNLLSDMVKLESFKNATKSSISSTRMADKEMALRFAGFYILDTKKNNNLEYKGDMDGFLDQINELLNKFSDSDKQELIASFDNAMNNAYILFGDRAFRKTTHINKALFLSWSRQLWKIDNNSLKCLSNGIDMKIILDKRIENDASYSNSVSGGTNDINSIETAFKVAGELLEGVLNDK